MTDCRKLGVFGPPFGEHKADCTQMNWDYVTMNNLKEHWSLHGGIKNRDLGWGKATRGRGNPFHIKLSSCGKLK